jgi:lysyl-tRNA synthetase, class II
MVKGIDKLIENRLQKLNQLEELGAQGYPNNFRPSHSVNSLRDKFDDLDEGAFETLEERFSLAGRIMTLRSMGKAAFLHIKDRTGTIQLYVRKNVVGDEAYDQFKLFEVGDIIGGTGKLMKTRTGELTLFAENIRLVTKSLRPLPEKFHGLQDQETRYRQRYVDLFMNDWVRDLFVKRSLLIKYIRQFLDERDFMEVETPMMHPIPGGAAARPFVTHHNALDMELFLRIAPELYLKRLLVGGMERVYEINRSFRNEGLSHKHNPEFTMLEFYWAYANFNDLMKLTEEMVCGAIAALGTGGVITINDKEIPITMPFRRLTLADSLVSVGGIPPDKVTDSAWLADFLKAQEVEVHPSWKLGKLQVEIYDKVVEDRLDEPTFITHHPVETSPLSRRNEENPAVVDRFELIIAGREIANAFSELNDPRDQRARFESQVQARAAGDDEAHHLDHDYLRALEYGMPPAAGEGIGIDRLVMLATGVDNIKEVILFPLLRPEQFEPQVP